MAQPFPVVITDGTGKALTISGASQGAFTAQPFPVVICDANGNVQTLGAASALPPSQGGTGNTQAGKYGVLIAQSYVNIAQSTQAEAVVFTAAIPGGLLTATGTVIINLLGKLGTVTGAANWRVRIGASGSGLSGTSITNPSSAVTGINMAGSVIIGARGATNSQISASNIRLITGSVNDANTATSIDTTAAWEINVTLQLTNADASGINFQGASVIVYP